jgi:hypothetical protein
VAYTDHLRDLRRRDRGAFLTLIGLASGGQDLTLVDGFGDAAHAPRRLLAAAPEQLAKTRRDEARRRGRRSAQRTPRRAPPAASRPGEARRW